MIFYPVITIISILILLAVSIWKSNNKANKIVNNAKSIITKQQHTNNIKNENEKLLAELRFKYLEAQKSGADRIDCISKLKNEIEEFITDDDDEENEEFNY